MIKRKQGFHGESGITIKRAPGFPLLSLGNAPPSAPHASMSSFSPSPPWRRKSVEKPPAHLVQTPGTDAKTASQARASLPLIRRPKRGEF